MLMSCLKKKFRHSNLIIRFSNVSNISLTGFTTEGVNEVLQIGYQYHIMIRRRRRQSWVWVQVNSCL